MEESDVLEQLRKLDGEVEPIRLNLERNSFVEQALINEQDKMEQEIASSEVGQPQADQGHKATLPKTVTLPTTCHQKSVDQKSAEISAQIEKQKEKLPA